MATRPSGRSILGADGLFHPTCPCLNVRDHTEPSSHDQSSRVFLVNTRPEHQEVSIGILDVEQEGVRATGVKQLWHPRLRELQAIDQFPIESIRIQVNCNDRVKDLGFLSPSQTA